MSSNSNRIMRRMYFDRIQDDTATCVDCDCDLSRIESFVLKDSLNPGGTPERRCVKCATNYAQDADGPAWQQMGLGQP